MKLDFWIKIKTKKAKYGFEKYEHVGVPNVSKNKPSINKDEFAFKVNLSIPDAYFQEPELSVAIAMPESLSAPKLTVDLAENIGEIIQQQLGVKAHLSITSETEQPNDQ